MFILWHFKVVYNEILQASSCIDYITWIHHVFPSNWQFNLDLRCWNLKEIMHVVFLFCSWNLGCNCVHLAYFWAWFYKLIFKDMLYCWFLSVFQKIGPKGWVLRCWMLGLSLGGKSGNSRFWFPHSSEPLCIQRSARATECWLERELQALRFLVHTNTRSNERTYARARTVSHARASVERRFSTSSTFCIFSDRSSEEVYAWATPLFWQAHSSEESHARARLLFSENFEKCFKVHLCILISS